MTATNEVRDQLLQMQLRRQQRLQVREPKFQQAKIFSMQVQTQRPLSLETQRPLSLAMCYVKLHTTQTQLWATASIPTVA
jgi:hypothetical protein